MRATIHRRAESHSLRATWHCLTGCAIGEVLGHVIATAHGLRNVALAVALLALLGSVVLAWCRDNGQNK
jgi:threonine/homoserine/homoserine lactone efflux protein